KLKVMYWITILIAGVFGILMLIAPSFVIGLLSQPAQDPYIYGVVASMYFAFGILSVLGLFDPIKYMPILLLQLIYKLAWSFGVFLPNIIVYGAQFSPIFTLLIFLVFIIGDILVLPFKEMFKRKSE
ncbi:MAG: hypothetical protein ACTSP9_07455, partial [Promethearchaeota archaeon]